MLNTLPLEEAKRKKHDEVCKALGEHFTGEHNIIYERARFNSRYQQHGEMAENFITDVHRLAEHCQYGVLREEIIRDRIVVGIRDSSLSEKLQLDPKLILENTITQVKQKEDNSH